MKILYILKRDPDEMLTKLMDVQKNMCEVTVIDIRQNKNYTHIMELIENNDRIILW